MKAPLYVEMTDRIKWVTAHLQVELLKSEGVRKFGLCW